MAAPGVVLRSLHATPAMLRGLLALNPRRYPLLLDSATSGAHGRWTILAAAPRYALALTASGDLERSDGAQSAAGGFLAALEECWQRERQPALIRPDSLPFVGGWCIFLGYEIAVEIEPRLRLPRTPDPYQALALRIPAALLYDSLTGQSFAVAEPGEEALLDAVVADLRRVTESSHAADGGRLVGEVSEEPPELFLERVQRLQAAIAAGEIYQANLARAWHAPTAAEFDAHLLYERLRRANPAPFAAFLDWQGMTVLSSSPERLLHIAHGRITTRPIAGTYSRGVDRSAAAAEMAALVAHPKERAEHVMLIDLERNDLGRVCEAGSVEVDEFMAVESYPHVHHLVSSVAGRLRPEVSPVAALRAVFPGGTITGCPKIRCMELVAREEVSGRGAYTGSLGYLGHDGSADFNILIRSMTVARGQVVVRTGAGIVADSDPMRELAETRAKARAMITALEATA